MRTTVISSRTLALVLVLLVIVAYGGCVNYPFVYDDLSGIVDNPLISGAETVAQASRALLETWRPATRFTYALTHALFGFSKPAFHATNLAAHILNTLLVFGIAIRLAKRWMPGFNPAHFGFAAGMIHAVHPLYTEAVTYISGRSSSLCGLWKAGTPSRRACGLVRLPSREFLHGKPRKKPLPCLSSWRFFSYSLGFGSRPPL